MRVSSNNITLLSENEIFVFGSNLSGIHGGGAAKLAYDKFEAKWGVGVGLTGCCYAIPTKSKGIERSLTVEEIKPYVDNFIEYAIYNPKLKFLVTEIGCGLAGHKVEDITPLFKKALEIENIYLPKNFIINLI